MERLSIGTGKGEEGGDNSATEQVCSRGYAEEYDSRLHIFLSS